MANDHLAVPEKLSAPWFKRFFKAHFGIPVRVQSGGYIQVWIQSCKQKSFCDPLKYDHLFPDWFGNLCMRTVYAKSEKLSAQNWGGNIQVHSVAMHEPQWRKVLQAIIEREEKLCVNS